MSSTIFLEQALPASARRRLLCLIPGRAFAGSSRPTCRWGRARSPTEISASLQLCWHPTSRLARPDSIRLAPVMIEFQKCAPAWELSALAHGASGETSCCSTSFSSRMPAKHVRTISMQKQNPKIAPPLRNWPAAAADSGRREAKIAWFPSPGASSDYCAWDETDEICANARPVYANGWIALR